MEGLEEAGIHTKIYIFTSLFLFAMGLILMTLIMKYDGRMIGRFFDYAFFLAFLTKVPYIPAGWTPYDLTFWDKMVRVDTVLMSNIIKETLVRSRLKNKFIEYSIPANTPNNATYYASGLWLSLSALAVLGFYVSQTSRVGVTTFTIIGVISVLTLPGAFFYSAISTFLYSFKQELNGFREFRHYITGLATFTLSFVSLVLLSLSGFIKECFDKKKKGKKGDRGEPQQQPDTVNNHGGEHREHALSIFEKILMEGISTGTDNKDPNIQTHKKFTFNNLNLIRYPSMMLLIVFLQKGSEAMLWLLNLLQLLMLVATVLFSLKGEFESVVIAALFIMFEALLMMLLFALLITEYADRDPNSDSGFWWGTVPLISLLALMVLVKLIHTFASIFIEISRYRKEEQKRMTSTTEEGILNTIESGKPKSGGLDENMKDDGYGGGLRSSERKNLMNGNQKSVEGNKILNP